MTTVTTYPNGQTLTSTALTVNSITQLLQQLTCGMLGVNPPDYSRVRVDWPTEGQPFAVVPEQDVCFIACVPRDDNYTRVRDYTLSGTGAAVDPLTETWTYTRCWSISWTMYGPSSEDNARAIRSALFMDYFNDALNASNLFPLSDPPEVVRAPEQFSAQWWERADYRVEMYERVTETIVDGTAISVEVKINTDAGQVADVVITKT